MFSMLRGPKIKKGRRKYVAVLKPIPGVSAYLNVAICITQLPELFGAVAL